MLKYADIRIDSHVKSGVKLPLTNLNTFYRLNLEEYMKFRIPKDGKDGKPVKMECTICKIFYYLFKALVLRLTLLLLLLETCPAILLFFLFLLLFFFCISSFFFFFSPPSPSLSSQFTLNPALFSSPLPQFLRHTRLLSIDTSRSSEYYPFSSVSLPPCWC